MAAVSYFMDSNRASLPTPGDWAARALKFAAPGPLIRPLTQGAFSPIPTVDEAEKRNTRPLMDMDQQAIPEKPHVNLDTLVPGRVRLGEHTRLPVESASQMAPKMNPAAPEQQLSMWQAKGQGKKGRRPAQPRGGHRVAPTSDRRRGKGSPDSSSSRPSKWNDWSYEKNA